MMIKEYQITPIPAPRMTRADKWKKRPCVMRYYEYSNELNALGATIKNGDKITFQMPMPKSWSKKKRSENLNKPHTQKPDLDNLIKSFLDSVFRFSDDAHIHTIAANKIWSTSGSILVISE